MFLILDLKKHLKLEKCSHLNTNRNYYNSDKKLFSLDSPKGLYIYHYLLCGERGRPSEREGRLRGYMSRE